jgi:methionyl aminopeptidase
VSIDCGAHLNGWCGDAAVSFIVGDKNPDETDVRLIEATSEALAAGITAARPAPDWVTSHTPSAHSPANAVTD